MAKMSATAMFVLVLAGCAATHKDKQFIIYSDNDVDAEQVDRVRAELDAGLVALRRLPTALYENRFPITVYLDSANGVSNSSGGQGPIKLFGVGRRNPAAIHELTHVLTGYRGLGGDAHWSSEGFATYMQDEHGKPAYPTRGHPHELANLIIGRGLALPMADVMRARSRMAYFGLRADPWTRWRAYALSASLTRYLIETRGIKKFLQLYGRRSSADQLGEIEKVYGKPAHEIIAEWRQFVAGLATDMAPAERDFDRFSSNFR